MEYERDPQWAEPADREAPPPAEWLRLTKYLLGELDAEGCAEVEQWVAREPVRAPVVALLRQAWRAPVGEEQPVDSAAALARVIEQIEQGRVDGSVSVRKRIVHAPLKRLGVLGTQPLRRGAWYILASAGVSALALVVGLYLGTPHLGRHQPGPVSSYRTDNGERANITLPDGTTAVLNAASRMEVPADYLAGNHTLRLTGEALFTVRHHTGAPFTVLAGSTTTRVLGTTFLVRHYATDRVTTVAVRDGKVAVQSAGNRSIVLTAARQLTIDRTGLARMQSMDPTQSSFITGVLTLTDMSFPDAITELDRWYDADIRLGDPALAAHRVTGDFAAGSLNDLSDLLKWTFNMRVVRTGRVLTLFQR